MFLAETGKILFTIDVYILPYSLGGLILVPGVSTATVCVDNVECLDKRPRRQEWKIKRLSGETKTRLAVQGTSLSTEAPAWGI